MKKIIILIGIIAAILALLIPLRAKSNLRTGEVVRKVSWIHKVVKA